MITKIIKFVGFNKTDSIYKALKYYYSHYKEDVLSKEDFLAKCRLQKDKVTIHYYPDLKVEKKEKNESK